MSASAARSLRTAGTCLVLCCAFSFVTPAVAATSAPCAQSTGFRHGDNLNWDVAPGVSENLNWD